jgi:disulfide oxidoreductase YuzD
MLSFRDFLDEGLSTKEALKKFNTVYPRAKKMASGLEVGTKVANTSSISASLSEWEELPGIREVKFKLFKDMPGIVKTQRTKDLAEQIKTNQQIDPLIVVEDGHKDGPYILEGAHRWDALRILKVKSFPALVVLNTEAIERR